MLIGRIVGAHGHPDLRIVDGVDTTLEAGGRVLLPAFVDAHVHLDKAYLLDAPLRPDLDGAIATVASLRSTLPASRVRAGADRAVNTLVRHGTTAARVHVETDPAIGLDLVHLHRKLADENRDRIHLQLCAFPQRGLELPGAAELLAAAVGEGLDVVGGCPYVDRDPGRHLDIVFGLAERYRLPVDLHLDLTDDPGRSLLRLVAERTAAHGMAGLVTVGHVTTLAAMAPGERSATLDLLARNGISLVVLPATDLYLTGHGDPGTRSLAPVELATAAGVRTAIASNNLHNPFAPFGNGSLLHAAWLTGITRRTADPLARQRLLDAITTVPAGILGLPAQGPGAEPHLILVDAEEPDEVILQAPPTVATLRSGRLVYRAFTPRLG
jgi:cytosine deaminase